MNADPAHQRTLLEFVRIDGRLLQLRHRQNNLPEQIALDEVLHEKREVSDDLTRLRIRIGDLARDISKVDDEVTQVRVREERDRALLSGGTLTPKQLTEMDHELSSLERRQASLEDDELELMERREALEAEEQHIGASLDDIERRIEKVTAARDSAVIDIENSRTKDSAERERLAGDMDQELLALYERERQAGGVGAGSFTGGRCGACFMELDRGSIDRIQAAPKDKVVQCPECAAIIVRGV